MHAGGSLAQPSTETQRQLHALLPPESTVANPLDLMRDAGPERYAAAATALAHDSGTDVVLLLHHPTSFSSGSEIARALNPVPQGEALVLAAFAGAEQQQARRILGERGIAAFPTPEAAVRAYGLNRRYFQQKSELMQTPPPLLRWPRLDPERIASRVMRAATELGIRTVGIYAQEDRFCPHRFKADEAYELNKDKGPLGAYLDYEGIVALAKEKGVDAIHPGYGFLSENPDFSRACEKAGIDAPVIPGILPIQSWEGAKRFARRCGWLGA